MDLGGLVARNARMVGAKEAVVYNDRRYTWAQVNQRVNAVANELIKQGVQKGDKVALWELNTDNFVFAFYGAVKAGAVAVPVNYRLAPREAEWILDNSDSTFILFNDFFEPAVVEMKPRLPKIKGIYSMGEERYDSCPALEDLMAEGDVSEPGVAVDEYDDSMILYTSGTTGKPKGAVLTHHNQMVLTCSMASMVGINPDDIIMNAAPLFHAAQLNLFLNPGTYMGATHIINRDFEPTRILQLIEKEKVTQFFGAPIMYMMMMGVPDFEKFDLSTMRFYGYGAAPMTAEAVKQMIKKFQCENFFCMCGQTEAGPGGVALKPSEQVRKAGAGGKYIVNMECRLADENDNDVTEPGVVGELCIKGETCMREYYKNPEATAATIIDGWVHSGDLAVMDDEGYITLVDRAKDMIITGGENVYSKEVEDAIAEHPSIADNVIIGVPNEQWGETVMAVVVLTPGASLTIEELREFLETRLADYKRPRLLEIVDMLPRNVSGKVLKFELRDTYKDASA
ncbi:feruloyl-CoA synthase [Desulfatibacillum alkenivorans DSM 16219]|jgi:acyl-CoA synthetase (AMP-forming)/AMP-acid ligase II|uniref:Feruloyl-CoA synthase n=1 Tax=Desulfatibacillum alkenivorans DSM 16219 TaxID=1121393 RepID=A0A1M6FEK7_9BACT|nr:long-chain-fatty-acid--CoA ligase [Desulfatibacillum alkenivorans]SHI96066.1 feruloyl-CoA synthase [Desulfatibacillum alkenivorans DSM 16219]